jgi:hypothetical protein
LRNRKSSKKRRLSQARLRNKGVPDNVAAVVVAAVAAVAAVAVETALQHARPVAQPELPQPRRWRNREYGRS